MARASQIYLIYSRKTGKVISAHTVKYEAFQWCVRCDLGSDDVCIVRMRDGVKEMPEKELVEVEWPTS